jgi:hypothetical protein
MDAIKQVVSDVTGSAQADSNKGEAGAFPKPDDFSAAHSQRDEGKKVGIQAEMADAPHTTDQESHYGFSTYKAAGKMIDRK